MRKQRSYALINVFGMALGMASCLLILLFVRHERSYDAFHTNADRIYRLAWKGKTASLAESHTLMASAMAPALGQEIPEVLQAVRYSALTGGEAIGGTEVLVVTDQHRFFEEGFYYTDASFFDVFSFPFLQGNAPSALTRPYTLVLTATLAEKYFGDENPIGRTLTLNNAHTFEITGVVEDPPSNSHLQFNILASYQTRALINPRLEPSWLGMRDATYLLLAEEASPEALPTKLETMTVQHMEAAYGEQGAAYGQKLTYLAQPLRDLHLKGLPTPQGNLTYLYLFIVVALLVMGIACINYMNLSTARFSERAREVGIRKSIGASRSDLFYQFLLESVLLSFSALLLALALVELLLPAFNLLLGKPLSLRYFASGFLLPTLLGLTLLVGLLAGSYPALFLSAVKPIHILKGTSSKTSRRRAPFIRRGLVVFQFAISALLIAGTLVIERQLDFVQNKPLGFEKDQVLVIPTRYHLGEDYVAFKQALLQHPNIQHVTTSSGIPTHPSSISFLVTPEGATEAVWITTYNVDLDFLATLDMKLSTGRGFSQAFSSDAQAAVLINEAMARTYGWDAPVGKTISFPGEEVKTVIGVIEDFHHESLEKDIAPLLIQPTAGASRFIAVRTDVQDLSALLAFLEDSWASFVPEWPFEYSFLDEDYARLYTSTQRLSRLFIYFSMLAILIACLGLLGLATFTARQRTKEIGIRKVLGASVPHIVLLLCREFATLVLLSLVVAVPIIHMAASRWLDHFAYRIQVGPSLFLLVGVFILGLTVLTVSHQAIKAALMNPVKTLRYE